MLARHYGTFFERSAAQLLNLLLLVSVLAPLIFLLNVLLAPAPDNPVAILFNTSRLLLVLIISVYGMAWFTHRYGGSPGKRLMGLQVVKADSGEFLSIGTAMARSALALISTVSVIGILFMFFDSHKRALHDHIMNTMVVDDGEDDPGLSLPDDWERRL